MELLGGGGSPVKSKVLRLRLILKRELNCQFKNLTYGTIRIIVGFFLNMFPNRENRRKWPLRNFIFFLLFFSDSFLCIFPVAELVNKL